MNIKVDSNESSEYKWISVEELRQDKNYGRIVDKFDLLDLKNILTSKSQKWILTKKITKEVLYEK